MDNYSVYVLWSEKIKRRYVGATSDVLTRLTQHNKGMTPYTSTGMPWTLLYTEQYATLSTARQRERFLKSGAGREFLNRTLSDRQGYPECEVPADCLRFNFFKER